MIKKQLEANYISHYHDSDNMSSLISNNKKMLLILHRFGIAFGFGNKSIEEVCKLNNVDTNTFLAVVNQILTGDKSEHIKYSNISINDLHKYLLHAHKYYLYQQLPLLKEKLSAAMKGTNREIATLTINYFDKYTIDVTKHLEYEEKHVFSYVENLVYNHQLSDYSIYDFSEHHDNIEEKLDELQQIIIKYINIESNGEIVEFLLKIMELSEDLESHTSIEETLYIPMIQAIENDIKKELEVISNE